MRYQLPQRCSSRRDGLVLLAVLVVLVALTLAAYQFSAFMTSEANVADSYIRAAQARAMAESGIHYAAVYLSNSDAFTNTLAGNAYDNGTYFQSVIVQPHDVPRFQGRFSIVAALDPNSPGVTTQPFRFGVTDESGKINLTALMQIDSSGTIAQNMLMALPNMTEELANAILDWIDSDDEPRTNGAEGEYYGTLSPPYSPKNGPMDSLEELLFVRGVTPDLLFGNDRNRNGILDPDEDDGTGVLDPGWSAYLTVYSRETNFDADGNPRIFVNDQDIDSLTDKLTTALGSDLANYIIAYRMYGPASGQSGGGGQTGGGQAGSSGGSGNQNTMTGQSSGGGASGASPGRTAPAPRTAPTAPQARSAPTRVPRQAAPGRGSNRPRSIASLYELINSQVSIPGNTPQDPATIYPSPLNDTSSQQQLLPLLFDKVTTVQGTELPPRINVLTAPQVVLSALPGITDDVVQNIMNHRPDPSSTTPADPIFQTPAWLITEANVNPQTLRSLERYITSRSQVYRVQSIGYFDGGGPTARIEAVIDTNNGRPRIVYWRDLTELGKGFNLQNSP
jgi:type II secretory pathway component PulK